MENIGASAAAEVLWPVGKACLLSWGQPGLPKTQSVEKQSLPTRLIPLLCSELITTNMLLQAHLFWRVSPFCEHSVFFEKMCCQEAQVLRCLISVALEECRMVEEKWDRKRNK